MIVFSKYLWKFLTWITAVSKDNWAHNPGGCGVYLGCFGGPIVIVACFSAFGSMSMNLLASLWHHRNPNWYRVLSLQTWPFWRGHLSWGCSLGIVLRPHWPTSMLLPCLFLLFSCLEKESSSQHSSIAKPHTRRHTPFLLIDLPACFLTPCLLALTVFSYFGIN